MRNTVIAIVIGDGIAGWTKATKPNIYGYLLGVMSGLSHTSLLMVI